MRLGHCAGHLSSSTVISTNIEIALCTGALSWWNMFLCLLVLVKRNCNGAANNGILDYFGGSIFMVTLGEEPLMGVLVTYSNFCHVMYLQTKNQLFTFLCKIKSGNGYEVNSYR